MEVVVTTSNDWVYQAITTTVGAAYRISFDFTKAGGGRFYVGNSVGSGTTLAGATNSGSYAQTFVATATTTYIYIGEPSFTGATQVVDNVSVRELTRYPVSIQMNGRMTYADEDNNAEAMLIHWYADASNYIRTRLSCLSTDIGSIDFLQNENGNLDIVDSDPNIYAPGILVPFNIASRHGMTFINGAVDGVALTEDTTPTNLPDLSATDLNLAYDYMGTVETFRVWGVDLGDGGIELASAPSLEPSLSLTFDSSESSFVVDDWSA